MKLPSIIVSVLNKIYLYLYKNNSKYIWYLSYLYLFFFVDTMCVNKREVTVYYKIYYIIKNYLWAQKGNGL